MARVQQIASVFLISVLITFAFAFDIPWERTGSSPSPQQLVKITVAITQQNLDLFEKIVLDVSNPYSENYGKYLTHEEIANVLSPKGEYANNVMRYFLSQGVPSYNLDLVRTKDVLVVRMPVEQIEQLFSVELFNYVHIRTGRIIVRSNSKYSIPEEIKPFVDLIHGISELPPSMKKNGQIKRDEPMNPNYINGTVLIDNIQPKQGVFFNITFTPTCSGGSKFPCPSGQVAPEAVIFTLTSGNPNIPYQYQYTFGGLVAAQSQYWYQVPVETYVPMNVSLRPQFPNQMDVPTTYFPYLTVATPQIVPQTLYSLYNIPSSPHVTNPKATQCVVEFEEQYYSPNDLDMFFQEMGLESTAEVTVIGPNEETNPGVEANLDIQWIMAMAPGAPTTFWSIYANSTIEIDDILQWEYAIGNMTNPPLVNSLSYGMTEDNVDTYLGVGYLNRSLTEFQKLAALGLTVIIADGDVGSNDLGAPPMSQVTCFPSHADWPSNSPFVTAVGSTYITPLAEPVCYQPNGVNCLNNPVGEVTVSVDMGLSWTTGGGFSNFTTRQAYQEAAVAGYFAQPHVVFPPEDYFNPNGRGYADAVTVGHNLMVVFNGKLIPVDGTSASAPIFAGIITLLNDARLNSGKPPLGFLNPLLYGLYASNPDCYKDIIVGHNRCGSLGWYPVCCPYGYQTSPGWDPVSGVGSPDYSALRDAVLNQ